MQLVNLKLGTRNFCMPEPAIEEYESRKSLITCRSDEKSICLRRRTPRDLPVILKGPTGCGKTRFVEHMAWRLERPLITVACHEDLSSTDLVGRFLLEGEETVWHDGPLTSAVRNGAICYLDEVVEARKDTVVIIHPLTDHRRRLPIEKRGTILDAPPDFMLVVSYNPGYQSILKDLKQSTRQRFVAIDFDYPPPEMETEIVAREGGVDEGTARDLVLIGQKVRNLRGHGLEEGVSTRLLIYAAQLIALGIPPVDRRRSRDVLAHHRRPRTAAQHPRDRHDGDLSDAGIHFIGTRFRSTGTAGVSPALKLHVHSSHVQTVWHSTIAGETPALQ